MRNRLQCAAHDLDYGKNRHQKREQWQGARFCEEAGEGKDQERDGKCHDAAQRVKRAKREERLDVPHADAGGVAKAPPERLSEHKGKVDDDRKTGVVKRRGNALSSQTPANAATAHTPASSLGNRRSRASTNAPAKMQIQNGM